LELSSIKEDMLKDCYAENVDTSLNAINAPYPLPTINKSMEK